MLEYILPANIPTYSTFDSSYRIEKSIENYTSNDVNYLYYIDKNEEWPSEFNNMMKSIKDLEITIDNQIAAEINTYGYNIENIEESSFKDFDKEFKVYTVELKEEIEDYTSLLKTEKAIKEKLNLFSKGIMLELV
ncbi:hypothetical protein [Malaciobacter marinus]|jgi:hypothetical protein|uniref:hypothetical protein n=1 Tax=Malaciobacter marinus TaxID=505249 RepID=UPI0009A77575|nr:hypothetical protein [Malaciobacter marinus]SKB73900.1 hypothetical protein SAMN06295997_13723 [Malaciobacter marinus]